MSLYTPSEGYPYPIATDMAAGPAAMEALAASVDLDVSGFSAAFVSAARPQCFLWRTTSNGSAVNLGSTSSVSFQNVDFANAPNGASNMVSGSNGTWQQTSNEGISWWYFGFNVVYENTTTPTNFAPTVAFLQINDPDPTSGVFKFTHISGETIDSGAIVASPFSGGMLMGAGIVQVRGKATGSITMVHSDAATSKFYVAGSVFYGFRIGGVAS